MRGASLGGARALQHRARRLRQARPRPAGDGVGGLAGQRAAGVVRRAPGPLVQVGQRAGGPGRGARRPRGDPAALAARDRRGVHRHLQVGRHPALPLGALRGRRHPPSPRGLGREGRDHRRRQPRPHPGRPGRVRAGARRRPAGRRLHQLRDGRHLGRGSRPALLLVGHDGQGQGHPPRSPLSPRARGVRVLPRRSRRRAVPRLRRVGVGRRHLPAARPVALRRGGAGAGAQGRLRPRRAPRLPLEARGPEHVHHAHGAAGDDRRRRRRQALSDGRAAR